MVEFWKLANVFLRFVYHPHSSQLYSAPSPNLSLFYTANVHADRHLLQDAIFVGFDVHQRQPNLARAARYNAGLADLVRRIHWVHGNLYVRFSTRFLASVVPDLDLPLQIGVAITTMFTRLLYPCDKR